MLDGLSLLWAWHPATLALLFLFILLYILGVRRIKMRYPQDTSLQASHVLAFFLAIFLAAFVLLTPVDTIGRTQLFSVHMAQAVILTTLCAPLILYGCPAVLLQPLAEIPGIRELLKAFTFPLVASLLFNLTFLFWHVPRVYASTQQNVTLYQVEMLSIFLTSILNWWPLLGSLRQLQHMNYPLRMLYAFFDGQPVDIFAFVLVFTGVALYKFYAIPPALNLTPFADQTVAGALLLVPGLVDLVVMTPLFFRWLSQIEQRAKLADERRLEVVYEEDDYEDEDYADEEESSRQRSDLRNHFQG